MPVRDHARHLIRMLVDGYFDFAGDETTGHLVLSGYFARPDVWCSFGDAWGEILAIEPAVPYWHKRELGIHGRIGRLLSPTQIAEREALLRSVIATHEMEGISQSISRDEYRRFVKMDGPPGHRIGIYWPCFASVAKRIRAKFEARTDIDSVSVYFEPTVGLTGPSIDAFDSYLDKYAEDGRVNLIRLHRITGPNVKARYKALQAADTLCWNIHAADADVSHERSAEFRELMEAAPVDSRFVMSKDIEAYAKILVENYDPRGEKFTLKRRHRS